MTEWWTWGVDPHVTHIAFAAVKDDELRTVSVKCASQESPTDRLWELYKKTSRQALYFACSLGRPACIAVEEPIGRFRSPMLSKAAGVAQVALYETLRVPVWTIPPTEWKKWAVGNGRASKRDVGDFVATAFGHDHNRWTEHECDAAGIATAAAVLLGATREKVAV